MNRLLWLLRRELWESRVIWMAPAICALIIVGSALLLAFGVGSARIDGAAMAEMQQALTPDKVAAFAGLALGFLALPFFVLVLFTQIFYTLDSLYGERRDRSILFWKSLPISDRDVVLSKLTVALVVMPLAAVAAALVTQVAVFVIASAKLSTLAFVPALSSLAGHLWQPSVWAGSIVVMAFVVGAGVLWFLPLIGWCLLVSAWAPRSPFTYAVLPPLGLALAEWIVLRTHYALAFIGPRVGNLGFLARSMGGERAAGFGVAIEAHAAHVPHTPYAMLRATEFLSSPDVWIGVLLGAGLVMAAIWMRRHRDASI